MGFSTDGIVETEDAYIVEGKIYIPKDNFKESVNQPKTRGLDPDRDNAGEMKWYRNAGTLTVPNLEPEGVLYTDKSYYFEYEPWSEPYLSDYEFWETAIGIRHEVDMVYDFENQTNEIEAISLRHTFTEPGRYVVKGNSIWSKAGGYTDIIGKYHPEMYYGEWYQQKTYSVIDPLSLLLTITGPDKPAFGINTEYSVPTPPADVTFEGWEVSPSTYTSAGGLMSRNLMIKFTDFGTYTLTANFAKPGGSTYSVTQTITLIAPSPPVDITIMGPKSPVPNGNIIFTTNYTSSAPETLTWEILPMTGVRSITPVANGYKCSIDFSNAAANVNYTITVEATNPHGNNFSNYSFKMGTVGPGYENPITIDTISDDTVTM
jgi:hypothetical protein